MVTVYTLFQAISAVRLLRLVLLPPAFLHSWPGACLLLTALGAGVTVWRINWL